MTLVHERGDDVSIYKIPDGEPSMDVGDGLYCIYDNGKLVSRYTIVNGRLEGMCIMIYNKTTVKYSVMDNICHGQCIIRKKNILTMIEYNNNILQPGEWLNKKGTTQWILKEYQEPNKKKRQHVNYKHKR